MSAGGRNMVRVGQHWHLWEFASPDTGEVILDARLVVHLDVVRARWGSPLRPSSGYRTAAHNASPDVAGLPHSRHLVGQAIDFPIVDDGPGTTWTREEARAAGWIPRSQLGHFLALARAVWPRPEDVVDEGDHVHLEVG